jgi:hypothetical protein
MSDHLDRTDPQKTPSDNDLCESEVPGKDGGPQSNSDLPAGVRAGEEKASPNKEVDPPA